MKQVKKQESGRSMIEMVGVLAVMGLITAGAFVLIQSGMASQRRNHAVDDVSNIVATYRALFAEDGNFNALAVDATGSIVRTDLQPGSLRLPETNPWGGEYQVSGAGTTLTVKVTELSGSECTVMSARKWAGTDPDPSETVCNSAEAVNNVIVLKFKGF